MLGCRLIFAAYAKNVRHRATKCSLKTAEILLDNDGMRLPKFDIYQSAIASNCFKNNKNS